VAGVHIVTCVVVTYCEWLGVTHVIPAMRSILPPG
jgi:hypothetical protein